MQVLLKEQQLAQLAAEMQCAQQAQDQALQATLQQHQVGHGWAVGGDASWTAHGFPDQQMAQPCVTAFILTQAVLQQQRAEHEATVARNLSFIDRILADKDALSAKCGQLSKEVASAQVRMALRFQQLACYAHLVAHR